MGPILAALLTATASAPGEPAPQNDLLREIQEHFPAAKKWFGMVEDLAWQRDASGGLTPDLSSLHSSFVLHADPAGQALGARLPPVATGAHTIWVEGLTGVSVRTEELNVVPSKAELVRGVVVYRGALAGGDLLYKITPTHVDEYLYLRSPPAALKRIVELDVGPGVARLRQAGRLVELLSKDGVARLRLQAPVARAANGTRRTGTVVVEGMRIIEELDLRGLPAPILVDPDWTTTGTMTVAHWADYGHLRPDGTVMAVGGCALASCPVGLATSPCNQVLASTDVWTQGPGTWTAGPPLFTARYSYAGVPLSGGDLLVAGGCTASNCAAVTASAERWVAARDVFTQVDALPGGRANLTGAPLPGGDALVAGGCDTGACFSDAHRFGASTGTWTPAGALITARGYHTTTALSDGRVLVVGGCADPACANVLATAELFDPATGQWTAAGTMASPRAGHAASLLPDGAVLVSGGCATQRCAGSTLTTTEIWRSAGTTGGSFAAGPDMNAPRHHHSASPLPFGEVLLAGGADGVDATRGASDVFLPVSQRIYRAPRMMMTRAYHVAVALNGGDVLVGGGCNPATCLPWAEVFSPAGLPVESPDGGPAELDAGPEPVEPPFDAGPPFLFTASPHPRLFRSGAVGCSTDDTQDLVCPVAGWPAQDGEFQPNQRPKAPGDGEVSDPVTGLIWQTSDAAAAADQAQAIAACAQVSTPTAPAGSWRLPTVIELFTVLDYGHLLPAVDQSLASIQPTNYWSATAVAGSELLAWTVKFDAGEVVPLLRDTPLPVRCVRGTFTVPSPGVGRIRLAGALTPTDDTVRDPGNGLEWQRHDDGIKRSFRESLDYCAHLDLAGHRDWHLTNIEELFALVELDEPGKVKIDPLFDGAKGDIYWSSTYNEGLPTLSLGVTFNLGVIDGVTTSGKGFARCVRHLGAPRGCGCEGAGAAWPLGAALLMLRARRRQRH
jgi:hypothetical protein